MEETVKGFFSNPAYDRRLGCGKFNFNSIEDLKTHPGKDPGVLADAHNVLKLFLDTHKYAVVMLDFQFNNNFEETTVDNLRHEIEGKMLSVGWPKERFHVMVIDPELEVLMWQEDTRGIEQAIDYRWDQGSLRGWLNDHDLWDKGLPKPPDPKSALDIIRSANPGKNRTHSQIFRRVASEVSFRDCQDPAFMGLWQQLQDWFPVTYP